MGTDASGAIRSKSGVPVDLRITVDYGQQGYIELTELCRLLLSLSPPPRPLTSQPNPMTVRLADSGETLWGQIIGCLTAVTVVNEATLKTGVTYELTGVSGPSPIVLQEDAKAMHDTINYTARFFFCA